MKKLNNIAVCFLLLIAGTAGILSFSAMKPDKPKKALKMTTISASINTETREITTTKVLNDIFNKKSETTGEKAENSATAQSAVWNLYQQWYELYETPDGGGIIRIGYGAPTDPNPGMTFIENPPWGPIFDDACFSWKFKNGAWEPADPWWILAYL